MIPYETKNIVKATQAAASVLQPKPCSNCCLGVLDVTSFKYGIRRPAKAGSTCKSIRALPVVGPENKSRFFRLEADQGWRNNGHCRI